MTLVCLWTIFFFLGIHASYGHVIIHPVICHFCDRKSNTLSFCFFWLLCFNFLNNFILYFCLYMTLVCLWTIFFFLGIHASYGHVIIHPVICHFCDRKSYSCWFDFVYWGNSRHISFLFISLVDGWCLGQRILSISKSAGGSIAGATVSWCAGWRVARCCGEGNTNRLWIWCRFFSFCVTRLTNFWLICFFVWHCFFFCYIFFWFLFVLRVHWT